MPTNGRKSDLFYPELSYQLVGILFSVHNELGLWSREKQYSDLIEKKLKEIKLPYKREFFIGDSGNIVDFLIDEKIVLEIKAKRVIVRADYDQVQRYLQETGLKLGLIANFHNRYLKPVRVVKIDYK